MKDEAKGGNNRQEYLNEDDITLNPMIKVRYNKILRITVVKLSIGYKRQAGSF